MQIALGTPTPSKHMHSHWCHPHGSDTDRHGEEGPPAASPGHGTAPGLLLAGGAAAMGHHTPAALSEATLQVSARVGVLASQG